MSFDVGSFVKDITEASILKLRVPELLEVAGHYGISVDKSARKPTIQSVLLDYLVSKKIVEEVDYESGQEVEARRLARLEEREFELRKLELEYKFQLDKLKLESRSNCDVDITKYVRLVPQFRESEVDTYFLHFEKIAHSLKWPVKVWSTLLQSVLVGRAQAVYASLSIDQSADYHCVKAAILKAYELVPEAYRQKFRNYRKYDNQTYVEFARAKITTFDRWCSAEEVQKDYEKLRQLMLVEEFKRCIPKEVKVYLDEQKVSSIEEASSMADHYSLTHKSSFGRGFSTRSSQDSRDQGRDRFHLQGYSPRGNFQSPSLQENSSSQYSGFPEGPVDQCQISDCSVHTGYRGKAFSDKKSDCQQNCPPGLFSQSSQSGLESTGPSCAYCKSKGHLISECPKLRNKGQAPNDRDPQGHACSTVFDRASDEISGGDFPVVAPKVAQEVVVTKGSYGPFLSKGEVSLVEAESETKSITILRDTGGLQTLLLEGILPLSEKTYTGTSILMKGIECGMVKVPLHTVHLKSELVTGKIIVGVRSQLPVSGVQLLLGNDLAGSEVRAVNPVVCEVPLFDNEVQEKVDDVDVLPFCAMAKVKATDPPEVADMSDTFDSVSSTKAVFASDTVEVISSGNLSSDSSIEADPELQQFRDKDMPEEKMKLASVGYCLKTDCIMVLLLLLCSVLARVDARLSHLEDSLSKKNSYHLLRNHFCIDMIGNAQFVNKFDLPKGYWQIPLSQRAKQITAFVTPHGLYQFQVMHFGLRNASATLQRLNVPATTNHCDAHIDDVIVATETWLEHIHVIRELFMKPSHAKFTVNLTEFRRATVTDLGRGKVQPVQAKVKAIVKFPAPKNKELMSFLGVAGYHRKFCKNFAQVAAPLSSLSKKNVQFSWDKCRAQAFLQLKAVLSNSPVLITPDFNSLFKLYVDACDVRTGAVLQQEDSAGIDHPICYFSKKFEKHQKNYSTVEKETLALVLALQHFDVYLCTTMYPVQVFTDHNPLVFISKMKNRNQRLMRWSISLDTYNLEIRHIKGKDNILADALSRGVYEQ